jgi:hypothetical protein
MLKRRQLASTTGPLIHLSCRRELSTPKRAEDRRQAEQPIPSKLPLNRDEVFTEVFTLLLRC